MKKILLGLAVVASAMFANTLDEILASRVIRVGVLNDQAPFSSKSDGVYKGFEIQMAEAVVKKLFGPEGGKIEWVGFDNLEDRMTYLQENRVDLEFSNFTKTAERDKLVDFCNPYFSVGLGLLLKKDKTVAHERDLEGLRIAVQNKSTGEAYLLKRGDVTIVGFDKSEDAYKALRNGQVDGYINNSLTVMVYPIIDDTVYVPSNMRTIGTMGYLVPVIAEGNKALQERVNEIMIELSKERFFHGIYEDTFGVFYRGTADPNFFLLEDLYRMYD